MNKRLKGKFSIHAEDLACAGISIILGTLASPLSYTLAFLYVSYSYMRTIREAMISVFFILLCSLTRGILPAYSYALGFACYFVVDGITILHKIFHVVILFCCLLLK